MALTKRWIAETPRRWAPRLLPLLLASLGVEVGCDDGHHHHADEHGSGVDPCTDPRVDDFMVGTTKEGEQVRVAVMDAAPAEPFRGDNAWTLMITDPAGDPLDGYSLQVQPWMPDHGHGTAVAVELTDRGQGEVHVEPLNLHMAGLWEVRLHFELQDAATETVVLTVCVE